MGNILLELWRGELAPLERKKGNSKQLKRVIKKMETFRNALEKILNEQQIEFFETYADCVHEYADITAEEAFCDGFRLASRPMAEALCDDAEKE